jgi:hypothetical protein
MYRAKITLRLACPSGCLVHTSVLNLIKLDVFEPQCMLQMGLARPRQPKAAHKAPSHCADLSTVLCHVQHTTLYSKPLRSLKACCLMPHTQTSTHMLVLPQPGAAAHRQARAGCAGVLQPSGGGPWPRQACQTAPKGCERHAVRRSAQAAELGMPFMRHAPCIMMSSSGVFPLLNVHPCVQDVGGCMSSSHLYRR